MATAQYRDAWCDGVLWAKYEYLPDPADWWKNENIKYTDPHPSKVDRKPLIAVSIASAVISESQFRALAERWKKETRNLSAISAIVMHPAYLDIMGSGPSVIPFILRDLKKENNHWFTALRALAKVSPIKPEDAGNLKRMRESWLKWGKDNGYLD